MPTKTENLPVNVDIDLHNGGTIKYANEVIAIIAGVAASEVDGLAGMCTSGGIGDIIGRNRNITRGIKVELGSEEASVDIYAIVEYGSPIQKVAGEVQENVRKAIESMTGLHVVKVDVHVQGVSSEKENQARDAIEAYNAPAIEEAKPEKKKGAKPKKEKPEEPAEEAPAAEDQPEQTPAAAEEAKPEETSEAAAEEAPKNEAEAPAQAPAEEAEAPAAQEATEQEEAQPAEQRRKQRQVRRKA